MTSSEEQFRLANLAELLAKDLTQVDDEALVEGIRDAEQIRDDATRWSSQLIAELKRRHSWSEVVDLTGMKQTTLHNRVYPRPGARPEGD